MGDKIFIKIKNLPAQATSKLQSPWTPAHGVDACHRFDFTLRNISAIFVAKVQADRPCNPSITVRREPLASADNEALADSPLVSSACPSDCDGYARAFDYDNFAPNSDSHNSPLLGNYRRESIPTDIHKITDRKAGKRRDNRNGKADFVYGLVLASLYADSRTARGESNEQMAEMSDSDESRKR